MVERGDVSGKILKRLEKKLIDGVPIQEDLSKIFKVAYAMCVVLANKLGKKEIDDEVIRKYFWFEHDKAIEWRYNIYQDFDTELCKLQPGIVLKTLKTGILVKMPLMKEQSIKKTFVNVNEKDIVVIHYGYIIESVGKEFEKMWIELWSMREVD